MDEEAYLRELSELGRRHNLGLNGSMQLFVLEPEDMAFDYSADADGFVYRGSPPTKEDEPSDASPSNGSDAGSDQNLFGRAHPSNPTS